VIKLTRRGRTQLSVQIKDDSFNKLQAIKDETGLSNAKIIEMLLDSYTNTSTNINTENFVTEERVKELIQLALSGNAEKPKLRTMTPEEIEASCTSIDTSPPIPEWDEQAWLDEDFIEFSNDPNPPEIIRTKPVEEEKPKDDPNGFFTPQKAPIEDEDDDW
jgi:hypothetical protein